MSFKAKFAVPFFVLGLAAFGCSSSTTNNTGTGGTQGGTAGTSGGTAGTSGGTAGTSGGTAGTSGGTAGTSGGTAGTSGGTAGTSGGTAGTSGGTAGRGGTTGTGGSTAGTSGGTAGRGGTTGTGGGGASGTAGRGGTTGTGGGGASGTAGRGGTTGTGGAGGLPMCTSDMMSDPAMSAADYCTLLLDGACATATSTPAFTVPYANMGACTSAYTGLGDSVRQCRSYHLCNALGTDTATNRGTHCPHAVGMGIAACMAN